MDFRRSMVWRGSGTVTLKHQPEKISKQIDKVLAKMGQKCDNILTNQGNLGEFVAGVTKESFR